MAELRSRFSEEVPFPKGLMIWNYFDHEHIVGTHAHHYRRVRILAEADNWCFSQRSAILPFIPVKLWATQLSCLVADNRMRSLHLGLLGLLLKQDFHFEDIEPQGCRVTVESRLAVPRIFTWLQPFFHRLMRRWFYSVWAEDMEMRARRLKVWQLGFRDFVGLDYVNRKTAGPAKAEVARPYPVQLPVPKITTIARGGISRPRRPGRKLGYGRPELADEPPRQGPSA
jgi:hypothetical protein